MWQNSAATSDKDRVIFYYQKDQEHWRKLIKGVFDKNCMKSSKWLSNVNELNELNG